MEYGIPHNELLLSNKSMNEACIASYKEPHVAWFHLYKIFRLDKFIDTGSTLLYLPEDGGGRNGDWLVMNTEFPFGVVKMLDNSRWLCKYTKNRSVLCFKGVNFMICELYLNKTLKNTDFQAPSLEILLSLWLTQGYLFCMFQKLTRWS